MKSGEERNGNIGRNRKEQRIHDFFKIFLVVQVLGGLVLYPMVIAGKRADEKMTGIMHQEQEKTKKIK